MLLLCADHPIRSLFDTGTLFCFDLIGSQSDCVRCPAGTNSTAGKEQRCNQTFQVIKAIKGMLWIHLTNIHFNLHLAFVGRLSGVLIGLVDAS